MRSSRLALIAVLCVVASSLAAQCRFRPASEPTLTYAFQPVDTPYGLYLYVRFTFPIGPSGKQQLTLPTQWAGESLHSLLNLRAVSKDVTLAPPDGDVQTISAAPNSTVTLGYDLIRDWNGPLKHPLQFHPVLMPTYIQFTGSNSLVGLAMPYATVQTANFDWSGLPESWTLATSFGATADTTGRCQTFTGPHSSVDQALFAAGDYRILPFHIRSRPAVFAVRGSWTFTDAEAIADIQNVVGNVRAFWHDDNFPYFLVTLSPYDQDHGSSDGSAFTNAFWMYVSSKDSLTGLLPQLAHESFHAWNPFKMGALPDGSQDNSAKWFKEGATEYYAQLLTYRAGELSAAQYIDSINKDLKAFPASNSEYVRGRILSLWLDATIRRESNGTHSLDDAMFAMVRTAGQPYTSARILATVDRYLSPESQKLLEAAALRHADLPAPAQIPGLGNCVTLTSEPVAPFDLGLDFNRSKAEKQIVGVEPDGPAWVAGLRDGQTLITWSVHTGDGDTNKVESFTIRKPEGPRNITYAPQGRPIPTWAYHLGSGTSCENISANVSRLP